MPGENEDYFDVIMVLHIISYKFHKQCRDLYHFSCLFKTFGSMSEIMFSSDSMSKKNFHQLKIHECLLSLSTSLFWNGWKTMIQKCENDSHFPHLPFLILININCHPYTHSILFPQFIEFQSCFSSQHEAVISTRGVRLAAICL